MLELAKEFASIFNGYDKAYGKFQIAEGNEGKKKGRAITIRGQVTTDLWVSHLSGHGGIGIVPLRSDNTLHFGAIDIDDYSISLSEINETIQKNNFPLIAFRSKSGGAHLYSFFETSIPAETVRSALENISTLLGFAQAEIFPKQSSRPDEDSVGNWINMPYFMAHDTDRYALDEDGNAVPIDKVIEFVKSKRTNETALQHYCSKEKTRTEKIEPLKGGPPCLNTLLVRGFPPNTRNNSLFNLGVYAKKAFPDSWEETIEIYNRDLIDPPLDFKEVGAIVKSLNVKDYNYKCKDSPISNVCNKPKCLVCTYGVRPDSELPKLGKLRKILTEPPVWRVEVMGAGDIELSTEELQQPRLFQKRCMDALSFMPPMVKGDQWREVITGLLETLTLIEVPKETTPQGRLIEHLVDFLTGRVQAKKREEILSGKPYLLDEIRYFRMRDFQSYLDKVKFTEVKQNKVISTVKGIEGVSHKIFWNIKGSGVNVWSIKLKRDETNNNKEAGTDSI